MITLSDQHKRAIRHHLAGVLRPPPRQSVTDWCAGHVIVPPPQTQHPGKLKVVGREYMREPLDLFGEPSVHDVVLCFGSQTGKTTVFMGGVAWTICNDPCGLLWVMPSIDLARSFSETRFLPIIHASPDIEALVPKGKDRHDFKKLQQIIGAAIVNFIGSNSPANLASRPARRVILDEVDKFDAGGSGEADAVNLAEQRTKSFAYPQRWKSSTPTTTGGLIWQEFVKGDQRRYFVPCPACGHHVLFAWSPKHTSFPLTGIEAFVKWDAAAKREDGTWDYEMVNRTSHAECPHCKHHITDDEKTIAIRGGEWRATTPSDKHFRSYHLPSLYACTTSTRFGALAVKFIQAKQSLLGLQGFINGDLAEPWEERPDDRATIEVQSDYSLGDTWDQEEARFMTVDVQQSEFWAVVRMWSKQGASRLFWCGRLGTWGDVRDAQVRYSVRDEFVFVDASHYSDTVYKECCLYDWNAIKGERAVGGFSEPLQGGRSLRVPVTEANGPATPSALHPGSVVTACELLRISEDMTSDCLQRLRSGAVNGWSIAKDTPQEYRIQLASRVRRPHKNKRTGKTDMEWATIGTHGEHLWDCERYQLAAAYLAGVLSITPQL